MRTDLFARIEALYPNGPGTAKEPGKSKLGGWCVMEKALTLAAAVVALRARVSVEIGVWSGGSAIPIAMAHHAIDSGRLYVIDPWDARVSIENEVPANVEWWGAQDHEGVYKQFLTQLANSKAQNYVNVQRCRSDEATVPEVIDFLHIDGSHTMQAVKDVNKFATRIRHGGLLCFDDIGWHGGGVDASIERAKELGFVHLYPVGSGAMYQRL